MKNHLLKTKAIFFTILLLACSGIIAENAVKDVVEVANLNELRQQETGPENVYQVTGEVVITLLQQAYRGQIYVQDDSGAIMIDDPSGIIETIYNHYDGITGLTGTLSIFQNMLQFVPTEDPGEPTSTDNIVEPMEVTLDELTSDIQGYLVVILDVSFDFDESPDTFTHNESYFIYDDSGEGQIRTPNSPGLFDYFGAPVPTSPIDIIGVLHQRFDDTRLQPRSLADMGITDMHNIAALRNQDADNETVYTLTGEAFLTYQESFRNSKYIQDETAGILIDDNSGTITTAYDIYDGITGIQGTLSVFGNMLQFVPIEDPGPATSSNNVVEPVVLTMEDFIDHFMQYQARLVTIENVYFLEAGEIFVNGEIYEFTDDEFVAEFRTTFYGVDYIGDQIPAGELHLTGLPNSRTTGDYLTARNRADIQALTTYALTFEFIDEEDNPLDGVSLTFRGETIDAAPYHFPEVPVGTHPYTATKAGYHLNQGVVSVVDGDMTKVVVMVEIDPDMVTEFPWEEQFDTPDFPPQGWNHYALGTGGWELQNEQAYHNYTSQGQVADSWLITQQIQIPEDEILLLNFLERNQYMAEYGYSGVLISTGSGNPEHGHFTEIYESSGNIGIEDPKETLLNLASYAGKVVYIAFNYQGEFAHRWWVYDLMIDFAPEAIEVPNIATLLEQSVSPDLVYRITGEVIITHLQTPYRGQFYIQDETGATMIDDPAGVVVTEFDLYDGITGFTGNLGEFQSMFQFVPTEDPGQPSSTGNEIEPLELTLSELTIDKQGMLVLVRNVHFDEENPTEWTHNVSYFIYDDTGEGEIRTPNSPGLLDYFGEPVPATPKDIIGVLHQRHAVTRLLPRMLADFMDPEPVQVISPGMHEMVIFPNPASTHVTIDNGDNNIDKIRIYNLSGQIVKTVNVSSTSVQINITDIQPGMYIVQMVSGSEVKSMKLSIYR